MPQNKMPWGLEGWSCGVCHSHKGKGACKFFAGKEALGCKFSPPEGGFLIFTTIGEQWKTAGAGTPKIARRLQEAGFCPLKKGRVFLRNPLIERWWLRRESNPRHEDFQSSALPTELLSPNETRLVTGGRKSLIPSFSASLFLVSRHKLRDFMKNHGATSPCL